VTPLDTFLSVIVLTLGVGGGVFFHFNRNARLKRRIYPAYVLLFGVLVACWLIHASEDRNQNSRVTATAAIEDKHEQNKRAGTRVSILFFVGLITFINIVAIRFCDVCGRAVYRTRPPEFGRWCQNCGAGAHGDNELWSDSH
jgi:hypothetical protein